MFSSNGMFRRRTRFNFCLGLNLLTFYICLANSVVTTQTLLKSSVIQKNPPMSIAIILDMSSSSRSYYVAQKYKVLFDSLSHFVQEGNAKNEYFVVPFFTLPQVETDKQSSIADVQAVLKKLSSSKREGPTMLYDACLLGINKVSQGTHQKKIVLVFSDGVDTVSEQTLDDVQRALKNTQVMLYAVNVGDGSSYMKGEDVLKKMASISGGVTFYAKKPEDVRKALDRIKLKLNQ